PLSRARGAGFVRALRAACGPVVRSALRRRDRRRRLSVDRRFLHDLLIGREGAAGLVWPTDAPGRVQGVVYENACLKFTAVICGDTSMLVRYTVMPEGTGPPTIVDVVPQAPIGP